MFDWFVLKKKKKKKKKIYIYIYIYIYIKEESPHRGSKQENIKGRSSWQRMFPTIFVLQSGQKYRLNLGLNLSTVLRYPHELSWTKWYQLVAQPLHEADPETNFLPFLHWCLNRSLFTHYDRLFTLARDSILQAIVPCSGSDRVQRLQPRDTLGPI